jgi:WD40 repeat protein
MTAQLALERAIGLTAVHNAEIAVSPVSNVIAYPAGSVVVIYNIKSNKQVHFLTASSKVTAVAFSPCGKFVAVGELGEPGRGGSAVTVWRWKDGSLLRTLRGHSFGIACVAFSRDSTHIVSVGFKPPHASELLIVWAWQQEAEKVACAPLRKRVHALSFSEDGSSFVTAGERHIDYWYFDASGKPVESRLPRLDGVAVIEPIAGNVAERKGDTFVDVECGKGDHARNVYAVTTEGALCCFGPKRTLLRWVGLRSPGFGLAVTADAVMAACEGSMIHSFEAASFKYIATLPCPPALEQMHLSPAAAAAAASPSRTKPAALCIRAKGDHAFAVYGDRSLFVWDVSDPKRFGMYRSLLQHCGCVWDLQIPAASAMPSGGSPDGAATLPPHSFATAAADGTVRLWTLDRSKKAAQARHPELRTVYSRDMLRALSVVGDGVIGVVTAPFDRMSPPKAPKGAGLRSLAVNRDGSLLAAGDKLGNLHLVSLRAFAQVDEIMAHDDEIIRVAFSPAAEAERSGAGLLASASLDNLVHVFAAAPGAVAAGSYSLACTLDNHDAPITGMRFGADGAQLLTCAAVGSDGKAAAELVGATSVAVVGLERSVGADGAVRVAPTPLCTVAYDDTAGTVLDVDVDPTNRFVVTASQGKHINIWRMESGRSVRSYSPESECYKVELDPSGSYSAACCLDKRIRIFDFYTGKCVVDVGGHSGIVTCTRFTSDCKRLLSTSSDGCIFVWKFHATLTKVMRQRMKEVRGAVAPTSPSAASARSAVAVSAAAAAAAAAAPALPTPRAEPAGLLGMMLTEAHTEASSDVHTVTSGKGAATKQAAGVDEAAGATPTPTAAALAAEAPEDAIKVKLNESQLQDWARTQGALGIAAAASADAADDTSAAAASAAGAAAVTPPVAAAVSADAAAPTNAAIGAAAVPPSPAGRWTQSVDEDAKLLGKFPMRPTPQKGGGGDAMTAEGGSSGAPSPSHEADVTLADDITVEEIMRELDVETPESGSPRRGASSTEAPGSAARARADTADEEEDEDEDEGGEELHYAPTSPEKEKRASDFEVTLKEVSAADASGAEEAAAPSAADAPSVAVAAASAAEGEGGAAESDSAVATEAEQIEAVSAFDAKRIDDPQRDIERLMSPAPGAGVVSATEGTGAAVAAQAKGAAAAGEASASAPDGAEAALSASGAQSDPLRRSLTSQFLKQHVAEHKRLLSACVVRPPARPPSAFPSPPPPSTALSRTRPRVPTLRVHNNAAC